ncbi:hypothetical protein [Ignatzschineria sp. LJL83]
MILELVLPLEAKLEKHEAHQRITKTIELDVEPTVGMLINDAIFEHGRQVTEVEKKKDGDTFFVILKEEDTFRGEDDIKQYIEKAEKQGWSIFIKHE